MADDVTIDIRVVGSAQAVQQTNAVQQAQAQLAQQVQQTAQHAAAATNASTTQQLSAWQNLTQGIQSGWQQATNTNQMTAALNSSTSTAQQIMSNALNQSNAAVSQYNTQLGSALGTINATASNQGAASASGFWSSFTSAFTSAAGPSGAAGVGVTSAVGGLASRALKAFGIGFAVKEVFQFLQGSIDEYGEAEHATLRLQDVYAKFPSLLGASAQSMMDFTMARQQSTRFDADETNAAVSRLAMLKLNDSQLRGLIPLVQDYASVTGNDVGTAANAVSMALQGSSRALKQGGIDFKATGNLAYDYSTLMVKLKENVGGFADKEGNSAEATMSRLANRWGDMKEAIGEKAAPVFAYLGNVLLNLADLIGPPLGTLFDFLGKIWNVLQPIANLVGGALSLAFKGLGAVLEGVSWAFQKLGEGIKWVWDNTIGWIINKIVAAAEFVGSLFSSGTPAVASVAPGATVGDSAAINPMAYGARGMVLPGYSPGSDSVHALLAPGEGVLVPEVVRAIGPSTINSWNAAGVQQRFAFGGIAGSTPGFQKSALEQAMMKASWQSVFAAGAATGAATPGPGSENSGVSAALPDGDPVGRWTALATQALQMTGQYSPENLDAMLKRIGWESSGNPNAINNWDRNAKNGTPSQGLLQVIPPTFKSYAMPGYDKNITDPLSNMLASIRYADATYGSLTAAYLKKTASGGVAGYDSGGWLPGGGIAVSNLDKPEAVLTGPQWDSIHAAASRPSGNTITMAPGAIQVNGVQNPELAAALVEERFHALMDQYQRDMNVRSF